MNYFSRETASEESIKYFGGDTLAGTTWVNKYALVDDQGRLLESNPTQMHDRIIKQLMRIEKSYPDPELTEESLKELLYNFKYVIPGGSNMSGIGNKYKYSSLSNCFVVESPLDSYGGIFLTDQQMIQLMKRRGGVGLDLSQLRPSGTKVTNDARTSSGTISFMERFSNSTRECAQNGRRGALMLSIEVTHPDAEAFIDSKLDNTKVTGANISAKLTDEFMSCVKQNKTFLQKFPINSTVEDLGYDPSKDYDENKLIEGKVPGTYFKVIKAKKLWNKIIYNAWKSAEPGVMFFDTMTKESPADLYPGYETVSTNPCLVGDTLVWMADGNLKKIKDIVKGDRVMSKNLFTGTLEVTTVLWSGKTKENAEIHKINGLKGTEDHLIADAFSGAYIPLVDATLIQTNRLSGIAVDSDYTVDDDLRSAMNRVGVSLPDVMSAGSKLVKVDGQWNYCKNISEVLSLYAKSRNFGESEDIEYQFPFTHKELSEYTVINLDNGDFYNIESVRGISTGEREDVYDINLDRVHNFYANGVLVHNCGEIPLCPYDSCRLLSINLSSFVENEWSENSRLDSRKLEEVSAKAQRIMDNIIDLEKEHILEIIEKVKSDPEPEEVKRVEIDLWTKILEKTVEGRRTGVGITGLGDMMAKLGVQYGSEESIELAEEVQKIITSACYTESIKLAKQRGPFKSFDSRLEFTKSNKGLFLERMASHLPMEVISRWSTYGRRNIACLTIAPTGTVSLMTQTTSGIEPVFKVWYTRRRKTHDKSKAVHIDQVGDMFEEFKVLHKGFIDWYHYHHPELSFTECQNELENMSDIELTDLYEQSPYYKATAQDIDWVNKVRVQGAMQKWIDHSISCTVNVPNETSVETVSDIYMAGYDSGCKGLTIYRDGSRDGVLITTPTKPVEKSTITRPEVLPAKVYRFKNGSENWIAFIGLLDDQPFECFIGKVDDDIRFLPKSVNEGKILRTVHEDQNGKSASRYDFQYEIQYGYTNTLPAISAIFKTEYWNYARFVSGMLRSGIPVDQIVKVIDGLNSDMGEVINTWKRGISRALSKFIKDGSSSGSKCPDCGGELIYQGGCKQCPACGHTKCE